jgi:hypothetical protein
MLIWFVLWLQDGAGRKWSRGSPAFHCAVELVAVASTTLAEHAGAFPSGVDVPTWALYVCKLVSVPHVFHFFLVQTK